MLIFIIIEAYKRCSGDGEKSSNEINLTKSGRFSEELSRGADLKFEEKEGGVAHLKQRAWPLLWEYGVHIGGW